jgi:hypothetical protein
MTGKKTAWTIVAVVVGVTLAVLLVLRAQRLRLISEARHVPIEGAVIQRDTDTKKELPIADVTITATDGLKSATATSDASGYFKLIFDKGVLSDRPVLVLFHHPGYQPLEITVQTGRFALRKQLYVAAMVPTRPASPAKTDVKSSHAAMVVSNIKVRYTINARTENNVGSAVKTFQVINQGNVPCDPHSLCSPDGKWKAASGSVALDAGADNAFYNIRASCIAGPCPFTRIDTSGFEKGGRNITVSALDWSDTGTFLVEAEVYHIAISSEVRELYPVIYGDALNFTVPPSQEGVSLEAELDGAPMVFPLGPDLSLSWASCNMRSGTEAEKTMVYRCELKPGYRF